METLTSNQEQRMERALNEAIRDVNDGESPNDAIFKAASDNKLEPEFTRRVVEVFNSAYQLSHFNKSASAADRKSEFPLAEADKILERMYPSKDNIQKEAAALDPIVALATFPDQEERDFNAPEKVACEIPSCEPEPYRQKLAQIERQVFAERDRLQLAIEKAACDHASAEMRFFEKLAEVITYFRTPGHLPFADIETAVRSGHTKESTEALFDLVYESGKLSPLMEKRGAKSPQYTVMYDRNKAPYKQFEELIKLGQALAEAGHNKKEAEFELSDFNLRVMPKMRAAAEEYGELPKKAAAPLTAAMYLNAFSNVLNHFDLGKKDTPPMSKQVREAIPTLVSPKLKSQEAAANSELMLHDFMLNDDVIGGYDSDDVTTAFNEIASLAPRSVQQPLIMRSMLRHYLQQGSLETMEASQLAELENDLKRVQEPARLPIGEESKQ